jgi:hypothetical protein
MENPLFDPTTNTIVDKQRSGTIAYGPGFISYTPEGRSSAPGGLFSLAKRGSSDQRDSMSTSSPSLWPRPSSPPNVNNKRASQQLASEDLDMNSKRGIFRYNLYTKGRLNWMMT